MFYSCFLQYTPIPAFVLCRTMEREDISTRFTGK